MALSQSRQRTPRTPRQGRSRLTRQAILDAALAEFARTGYRGTDLRSVARAAGGSAPLILYHFGSKEALVWELVTDANHELHELANSMWTMEAEDALERFPEAGRLIEKHPLAAKLNAALLAENLIEGPLRGHFREKMRDRRGKVAEMLRRAQADGRIRPEVDAEQEASDLYAMVEGLVYHHLLDPGKVSIESGLRRYIDRMLAAIKQPD